MDYMTLKQASKKWGISPLALMKFSMTKKRKRNVILLCVGILCVILVVWTVWGNTALVVSDITLSSDHLPAPFSGFRIAQVSDLHNTEFGEGFVW